MIVHEIRGIHSVHTKLIQIIFSLSQTCLAVLDWTFSVLFVIYKPCFITLWIKVHPPKSTHLTIMTNNDSPLEVERARAFTFYVAALWILRRCMELLPLFRQMRQETSSVKSRLLPQIEHIFSFLYQTEKNQERNRKKICIHFRESAVLTLKLFLDVNIKIKQNVQSENIHRYENLFNTFALSIWMNLCF